MKRYQIWLRGSVLIGHVKANSKRKAMDKARDLIRSEYGYNKMPNGTCVCPINEGYYEQIARLNRESGFNASTDF